jgi:long-chain acyl-CoA synthetase
VKAAERALRPLAEVEAELTAPGQPFEMELAEIGGRWLRVWKRAPRSAGELIEAMRARGERPYLVYGEERISYAEAHARIAGLAHALLGDLGVQRGERVALALRNYPEWPLVFFAVLAVGAIAVPINAWWKSEEAAAALADCGACVIFADEECARLLEPVLPRLALRARVVIRAGARAPQGWRRFESLIPRRCAELPALALAPEDDATLFYTSGTTGEPKGALGTHRNLLTQIVSSAYSRERARLRRGELPPESAAMPAPLSVLVGVPFFHVAGSHSALVTHTAQGGKLVLMHRWQPERALALIERERISMFGGVPSMVWQVLESPDLPRRDTSSVTRVAYGGAPAPPELVRRIQRAFPAATASNGYGMTETSALSTVNSGVDYLLRPDSVGLPVAVVDVRVVDAQGREVAPGELGELCIRGPNVVKGYWNKPAASAQTFRDGWCHSGDIARIDAEGFVTIVDRAKDVVMCGEENVYCVEVEDVLYRHGAVMDAAVLGLPDPVLGERVVAVVQLAPGAQTSEEELRKHVAEHLAHFKVPERIERRSAPLPRSASGKILKRLLREELIEGRVPHALHPD